MEARKELVSSASSPLNSRSKQRGSSQEEIKPRPYQLELLEAAINENTIVNLGTGAGKTFIAVMLIREYSYQILQRPFTEKDAKRTVFLVHTVPLAMQQAKYVRTHTPLTVEHYIGEMGVDSWSEQRWLDEFDRHHVLVMTRAIFKDLLQKGFVHLRKVNLLIFDECHHAVKNDDYVQIMKIFDSCTEDEPPRILGLSASLLPSKCKPGDLETKIRVLEATLRCRSQTAGDLTEVAKYATNPSEKLEHYCSSDENEHIKRLRPILQPPLDFLNSFEKEQKSVVYEKVKVYFDDCLHILENLGVWCAYHFALDGAQELREDIQEIGEYFPNEWEKSLMYLGLTHLEIFVRQSQKELGPAREMLVTSKVEALLCHLGNPAMTNGENTTSPDSSATNSPRKPAKRLLGIVFVERRTTAALLAKFLNLRSQEDPDLKHLRCEYIVGHTDGRGGTHLRREAHMSVKKQNDMLEKFRKEKLNLLIATSVVEEGVDVPRCNLVVRFDFPQNFRSYIQSKGRARAKISTFLILIDKERRGEILSQLANYRILEKELQKLCHGRLVPGEEEILQKMEEAVPPYMPFGKHAGTRATLNSSLSLIHRYCQKLPSDRYSVLTPIFETEKLDPSEHSYAACSLYEMDFEDVPVLAGEKCQYKSTVTLPMSSPVKVQIVGWPMPTRRIAEKSAALVAVKKLHEAGELNDHLQPVPKEVDSEGEEEDEAMAEERKNLHAGTEKRPQDYPNEVASPLTNCFPNVGHGNHLYAFIIREAVSKRIYQSRMEYDGSHTTLGILTRKPIPHLKIPEFSLYDGEIELYVKMEKLPTAMTLISEDELAIFKQCHKTIFNDVLKIRATWLKPEFGMSEKNYLVVPVGIIPDFDPIAMYIDMDLATRVAQMGNNPQCSQPLTWPCPLETFTNALVIGIHRLPGDQKLHEVIRVDKTTTPSSPFPDPTFASFAKYFKTKYKYELKDHEQPSLDCKPLSIGSSRLRLLTSRFKSAQGEDLEKSAKRSSVLKLFPEGCSLYPLPAHFWKLLRCLPSILWRVECTLLVEDLRLIIALQTQIGVSSQGSELTTYTNLRGYEDYGFGNLKTQCFSTNSLGEEEVAPLTDPDFSQLPLRGPDNALFLQALTPKVANDSINLERLETLGDSLLKLATSVYLFSERPSAHEGRLTVARSRRVGNLNLYVLAKQRGITGKIFSRAYNPLEMWVPPCFSFNERDPNLLESSSLVPSSERTGASCSIAKPKLDQVRRHYKYHKVPDKGVADCVESLLGAYLVAGGIEAGLKFMKWMGIKIVRDPHSPQLPNSEEELEEEGTLLTSSDSSASNPPQAKRQRETLNHGCAAAQPNPNPVPLLIRDSVHIFARHFSSPPSALLHPEKEREVQRLLRVSTGLLQPHQIQQQIKWNFTDPSFLLQALTHASYTRNRVTECYQRLEFLGDAVLDYLTTCYIYQLFPDFGPGEISGMRSALVNNITFAELAVKLNLHKALLHNSPALFNQIPRYVEALENSKKSEIETAAADERVTVTEGYHEVQAATPSASASQEQDDSVLSDDEDEEEQLLVDPPKVLGDILESLAGAIFLDSGMSLEAVWNVFQPLFQNKIDQFQGRVPISPIQELAAMEPSAKTKMTKKKQGRVCCSITVANKDIEVRAEANTAKAAKVAAAKQAVKKLKILAHQST